MYPLKQSTSLTLPFFAHDINGDGVTGLLDAGFTKRISKGGGAFAAMTVTITEAENGFYFITLSTTHTDTLGVLTVVLTHASIKQVNLQWRVSAKLADDLSTDIATLTAYVDTEVASILAAVDTEITDIQSRIPAALVGGRMDSSVGAIANNAITAASIAADAGTEIADSILDRDMSTGTDSGSPTVRTVRQALRFLRNKWVVSAGTLTVYKENDSTASWTATVSTDAAAVPVIGNDPA